MLEIKKAEISSLMRHKVISGLLHLKEIWGNNPTSL
jgi:hypothetical protein